MEDLLSDLWQWWLAPWFDWWGTSNTIDGFLRIIMFTGMAEVAMLWVWGGLKRVWDEEKS